MTISLPLARVLIYMYEQNLRVCWCRARISAAPLTGRGTPWSPTCAAVVVLDNEAPAQRVGSPAGRLQSRVMR